MEHKLRNRILAVALIAAGLLMGITWNSARFCLGDQLFAALGLPAWSNGTSGLHYPAVVGVGFLLTGGTVLNMTLREKVRLWLGGAVWALILIVSYVTVL